MSEMLAERIQKDPENLQFITYSTHQQIRYLPNKTLEKFLEPNENALYYTILSIPLKEYENICVISVNELTARHQIKVGIVKIVLFLITIWFVYYIS